MMQVLLFVVLNLISVIYFVFFFPAEDGIRGSVAFRGVGDVFKEQPMGGQKKNSAHPNQKRIML